MITERKDIFAVFVFAVNYFKKMGNDKGGALGFYNPGRWPEQQSVTYVYESSVTYVTVRPLS